ncbi:hypothetical protein [Poseidonocella sp. HB161398]|uniref:hypothetical protein n=1 Tax=Poseidonocella sp. HB161398 TaxID=2320855 RepID=UPI0011092096|nr:hypothetical protein [Poseidonocella sp. HB161398]
MSQGLVFGQQHADGSFLSEARSGAALIPYSNGAATALCLEALWPHREELRLAPGLGAALDFLERCERSDRPGHFGRHPETAAPAWMRDRPSPDLDATALIAVTLYRYGRRSLKDLQAVYCKAMLPVRLDQIPADAEPWHDYDIFGSWLEPDLLDNPVDLIANINALVLLELLGQPMPEIPAIRLMLWRALDWAGEDKERMQRLSPWHPEPVELLCALERAERLGVGGLERAIRQLRQLDWVRRDLDSETPLALHKSPDGITSWSCPLLHELRRADPTGSGRILRRVQ